MVKSCIVCATEQSSVHSNRSFHKIPKDEQRKKVWLQSIGRESCYSGAVICSVHFSSDDFFDTGRVTTLPRLRPNATPKLNIKKVTSQADSKTVNNHEKVDKHAESTLDDISLDSIDGEIGQFEKKVTSNVNKRKSDSSNQNVNKNKRVKSDHREQHIGNRRASKTFCPESEYFKRKDFTSDEAWNKFVKHIMYRRQQLKRIKQNCHRQVVKIKTFKDMLYNLKSNYFIPDLDVKSLQVS